MGRVKRKLSFVSITNQRECSDDMEIPNGKAFIQLLPLSQRQIVKNRPTKTAHKDCTLNLLKSIYQLQYWPICRSKTYIFPDYLFEIFTKPMISLNNSKMQKQKS